MPHRKFILVMSLALIGCSDSSPAPGPSSSDAASPNVTEAAYPLDTCVVSGEKLGSMGDAHVIQVQGRTVKLCCAMCEPQVREEPAKYLAKLDAAASGNAALGESDAPHPHAH